MVNLTKILVGFLILALAILGVEGYSFWQMKNQLTVNRTEKKPSPPEKKASGFSSTKLSFEKITQKQASDLVNNNSKTPLLAGKFVSFNGLKITVRQKETERNISLASESSIFVKKGEDLPIIMASLVNANASVAAAILSPHLTKDDLLLFLEVSQKDGQFFSPGLVIFK